MALLGLLRRKPFERAGFGLYAAAVTAARAPALFSAYLVPDTLDGRFEVISLHVALLVRRLRLDPDPRGAGLAQAVFDAMFADMDTNLREMGVGDMSVGKRVRTMWEGFHGRAKAYEAAVEARGDDALTEALARNVWGGDPPEGAASGLAAHARIVEAALALVPLDSLVKGRLDLAALPLASGATPIMSVGGA